MCEAKTVTVTPLIVVLSQVYDVTGIIDVHLSPRAVLSFKKQYSSSVQSIGEDLVLEQLKYLI